MNCRGRRTSNVSWVGR